MWGMIANGMAKINMLAFEQILEPVRILIEKLFNKLWYTVYFWIVKAIAWILDLLTQLFFIFAGMTPVSDTSKVDPVTGELGSTDIVTFFLAQESFTSAYFRLCLIALALIVVFAIGKIIKQDYFDRTGPRSKGPIFRNIALSFIAFICVVPIFYFLIDATAALALMVMKAMGYSGGGIGTLIFNMCWDDNGKAIQLAGEKINDFAEQYDLSLSKGHADKDNFGWYSVHTFYYYYCDLDTGLKKIISKNDPPLAEFQPHIFIFTGLVLISNLGKMLLSMLSRLFKLIALFVSAPSPISQIVLDDGQKFKGWKGKVIEEALKVVGCVLSFMIFIMIVRVVNNLDIAMFAYTPDAASAKSLLDDNNLTTELSNSVSAMYYGGDAPTFVDHAINSLSKCMICIAGVGAINDMDEVITPFLSGAKSSMDSGHTGKAVSGAVNTAVNGALAIGKAGVGLAVSGAQAAVGAVGGIASAAAGAGAAMSAMGGAAKAADAAGKAGEAGKAAGAAGKAAGAADGAKTPDSPKPTDGASEGATTPAETEAPAGAEQQQGESQETQGADQQAGGQAGQAGSDTNNVESSLDTEKTESLESSDGKAIEADPNKDIPNQVEAEKNKSFEESKAQKQESGGTSKQNETKTTRFGTTADQSKKEAKQAEKKEKNAANRSKLGTGAAIFAKGALGSVAHHGYNFASTAVKTGGNVAGIMAKSLLKMTGHDEIAGSVEDTISGVTSNVMDGVTGIKNQVKSSAKDIASSVGTMSANHKAAKEARAEAGAAQDEYISDKDRQKAVDATPQVEHKDLTNASEGEISNDVQTALNAGQEQIQMADGVASDGKTTGENVSELTRSMPTASEAKQDVANVNQYAAERSSRNSSAVSAAVASEIHSSGGKSQMVQKIASKKYIESEMKANNKKYEKAVATVKTHMASNGGSLKGLNSSTLKEYNDYLSKSSTLDKAYRYLDGDATVDSSAYDSIRSTIESSKTYKETISRADGLKGKKEAAIAKFSKDIVGTGKDTVSEIQARSQNMSEVASVDGNAAELRKAAYEEEQKGGSDYSGLTKLDYLEETRDRLADAYQQYLGSNKTAEDKENLNMAYQAYANASEELHDETSSAYAGVIKRNNDNVARNKGNASYESAVSKAEQQLARMKANGASNKQIKKAEKRLETLKATGDVQAQDADRKVRGGKSKIKVTGQVSRAARQMERQADRAGRSGGHKKQVTREQMKSNWNMDASQGVEFEFDLTDTAKEITTSGYAGIDTNELKNVASAYETYMQDPTSAVGQKAFVDAAKGLDGIKFNFEDDGLSKAIKGITSDVVPEGKTVAECRKDATARYKNAISEYNSNMEMAAASARSHKEGQPISSTDLASVRQHVEAAMRASEDIRLLRVELKIDDKK